MAENNPFSGGNANGNGQEEDEGDYKSLLERCAAACRLGALPVQLVKTYIRYCRQFIPKPILTPIAKKKLKRYWLECRREYAESQGAGTLVTTRQLEALMRMSEARARADLSGEILEHHVDEVLEIARCAADFDMSSKDREMIHVERKSKKGTASSNILKFGQKVAHHCKRVGSETIDMTTMKEIAKTMNIFG